MQVGLLVSSGQLSHAVLCGLAECLAQPGCPLVEFYSQGLMPTPSGPRQGIGVWGCCHPQKFPERPFWSWPFSVGEGALPGCPALCPFSLSLQEKPSHCHIAHPSGRDEEEQTLYLCCCFLLCSPAVASQPTRSYKTEKSIDVSPYGSDICGRKQKGEG